jgi:hypothetical protein
VAGALAPGAAARPVPAGDRPDPSLLRAGGAWYAATTSNDWLPAFPLLRSPDLTHWDQVAAVLPRRPRWAARDFWAPELVRRGGRALVYYAALGRDGRRCIAVASAVRVSGPYRDHGPLLCSPIGEIDPLPVRDEHGADWLVWKRDGNSEGQPTPLVAAPLAPGGMSLAAPPRELFRGDAPWERGLIEGPELLRHDGLFYMLYSARRCCGLSCDYATGVARSAALLGPWEKRPAPILSGDRRFRCPGHGSVARGPGGGLEFAYHAYARGDPGNRRLLVAPLRFDAEGWPALGAVRQRVLQPPSRLFGFDGPLGTGWEWPVGGRPRSAVANGALELGPGALARRADTSRFAAGAQVADRGAGARPGLAAMASDEEGVGVELRGRRAVAWRLVDGRRTTVGTLRAPRTAAPRLRVRVAARVLLAVRAGGRWRRVGPPQPLPRWGSGPRVALTVGGGAAGRASFAWLRVEPL